MEQFDPPAILVLFHQARPEQVFELFFDLLARTFVLNLDHLLTREQYCKTVWP